MKRYAVVLFPSKQANGKHVNGTIALLSEHKIKIGTQSVRSCVNSYLSVPEIGTKMGRNDCVPMGTRPTKFDFPIEGN